MSTKLSSLTQNAQQEISLPSFEYEKDGKKLNDTKVVVKTVRTMGEQRALFAKYPNADDPKNPDSQKAQSEMMISSMISWNITGDDDKVLEITSEILDQLPDVDYMTILGAITGKEFVKDGKISKDIEGLG